MTKLRTATTVCAGRTTLDREASVETDLAIERFEVENVPIGKLVEQAPQVRVGGDVTIFPVMEEIAVVERRLLLKEELHVRHIRTIERHVETAVLREQHVTVTRQALGTAAEWRHPT